MNYTIDIPNEYLSDITDEGYDVDVFLIEALKEHIISVRVQKAMAAKYDKSTSSRVDNILNKAKVLQSLSQEEKRSQLRESITELRSLGNEKS